MLILYVSVMESNVERTLGFYFDFIYVREMINVMSGVFRRQCSGCQHGFLSQMSHPCLRLSTRDQVDLYFEDILREVCQTNILEQWCETVSNMSHIPSELVDVYKVKLDSRDITTDAWKWRMVNMVATLCQLEKRFK